MSQIIDSSVFSVAQVEVILNLLDCGLTPQKVSKLESVPVSFVKEAQRFDSWATDTTTQVNVNLSLKTLHYLILNYGSLGDVGIHPSDFPV